MVQLVWATNYYSGGNNAPNLTASWWTNTDGTGSHPANFTSNNNTFIIQAAHTMTTTANWTVSGTGSSVQVNGVLVANHTVTIPSSSSINSGATYQHNINGGTIPTATWDAASTCLVTGMTSSDISGNAQNFGNLTWDCSGQSFDHTHSNTLTIQGNLTILNTGTKSFKTANDKANTIGGNYTQSGGTFNLRNNGIHSLTVSGNFEVSGGSFANNGDNNPGGVLNVAGNFAITTDGTLNGGNLLNVVFNGSSDQTITATGTISGITDFTVNKASGNVTLNSNLGINAGSKLVFTAGKLLTGSNTVSFNATANLTGEATGTYLVGNLTTTRSVGSGSTFDFAGLSIGSSADNLGNVTLTRISGTAPSGTGNKLNRSWNITSVNPPSSGRNVTFSWVSDDDGTVDLTGAVVYKSTDNGTTWIAASGGQDVSGTRSITAPGVTSFSLWTVGDGSSPLPVELTAFSAFVKNYSVQLKWETATEVRNYGFEVERSADRTNWSKIAFIEGHGNSNSTKQYSYTDNKVSSGKYYYRLKQIDNEGTFAYSKEIEVTAAKLLTDFTVEQNFPNPFNPTTTIKFGFQEPVNAQVVVYNAVGAQVAVLFNERTEAGKIYSVDFDGSQFASGIYYYAVTGGNFKSIKKMILMK